MRGSNRTWGILGPSPPRNSNPGLSAANRHPNFNLNPPLFLLAIFSAHAFSLICFTLFVPLFSSPLSSLFFSHGIYPCPFKCFCSSSHFVSPLMSFPFAGSPSSGCTLHSRAHLVCLLQLCSKALKSLLRSTMISGVPASGPNCVITALPPTPSFKPFCPTSPAFSAWLV